MKKNYIDYGGAKYCQLNGKLYECRVNEIIIHNDGSQEITANVSGENMKLNPSEVMFYENLDDFKKSERINNVSEFTHNSFGLPFCKSESDENDNLILNLFVIDGSSVKEVNAADNIDFVRFKRGKYGYFEYYCSFFKDVEYFDCFEDAKMFLDFEYTTLEGEKVFEKSLGSYLRLTDKQKELRDRLSSLMVEMRENNLALVYDGGNLSVFNDKYVADYDSCMSKKDLDDNPDWISLHYLKEFNIESCSTYYDCGDGFSLRIDKSL